MLQRWDCQESEVTRGLIGSIWNFVKVSLGEADGPGFESFRIAIFGTVRGTFVVTEEGSFSDLEGPRIKTIRGFALNLSPLVRLLPPDPLVPPISVAVFITRKEMLTGTFKILKSLMLYGIVQQRKGHDER